MPIWRMTGQHANALRGWVAMATIGLALSILASCGWTPLYADREAGPADAELRAIRVAPIPERIGQKLALALRDALNPTGISAHQRYLLHTTLQTARADLGIQTQGFGTRGRLDVTAIFSLNDIATGAALLQGTSHVFESFDILANSYSNIVAEDDARTRAVLELSRDMIARLTVFLQRRAATTGIKP